jgi:hypothetical protein
MDGSRDKRDNVFPASLTHTLWEIKIFNKDTTGFLCNLLFSTQYTILTTAAVKIQGEGVTVIETMCSGEGFR